MTLERLALNAAYLHKAESSDSFGNMIWHHRQNNTPETKRFGGNPARLGPHF